MKTVLATGNTIRNCLRAAHKLLGLSLRQCEPMTINGERGIYRVTFATGDIVEINIVQHGEVHVRIGGEVE